VTRLLHAELLKATTTRILLWLALLIVGLIVLLVSLTAANNPADELAQPGHQRDLVSFAAVSALIALILGIIISAGEFAHGTIGQTFLVAPARERVVAAKLVTGAVAGLALAAFAEACALGMTALWVSGKSVSAHLGTHDMAYLVLGIPVAGAIAGAIGVGLGSLLRRQTGAIVLALIWLLVGEPVLAISGIQRYAPGHAIAAVVDAGRHSGELLHFWPGFLLALFYAALLGLLGTFAVAGTDVT